MNRGTKKGRFSKAYKDMLTDNIGELTNYLQIKTGYQIFIIVKLDEKSGYHYEMKITYDTWLSYGIWNVSSIISGADRAQILKELKKDVQTLDFIYNRFGDDMTNKIVCCSCGNPKDPVTEIHKNPYSDLFAERNSNVFICHECAAAQFEKILNKRGVYEAFVWVCAIYDRPFNVKLFDRIKVMQLSPFGLMQKYFKQLNLSQYRSADKLFADSDFRFNGNTGKEANKANDGE